MQKTAKKERPILFNGEMVRAILDGRKTQTRRVMKPQPGPNHYLGENPVYGRGVTSNKGEYGVMFKWDTRKDLILNEHYKCPYGAPGDELWVRETWDVVRIEDEYLPSLCFRADSTAIPSSFKKVWDLLRSDDSREHKWRPSIHMPRCASRIQLRITDARVERLQEISEEDMIAEGIALSYSDYEWDKRQRYSQEQFFGFDLSKRWINLWNSINDKRGFGWDVNPWVWVVEFEKV